MIGEAENERDLLNGYGALGKESLREVLACGRDEVDERLNVVRQAALQRALGHSELSCDLAETEVVAQNPELDFEPGIQLL